MIKKIIIFISILIGIISITFIVLNEKNKETDAVYNYAQNTVGTIYDDDYEAFTNAYGDLVAKIINKEDDDYTLVEDYYSYYNNNLDNVFSYNTKDMEYDFSLKNSAYKDMDGNLEKITSTKYDKDNADGVVICEMFFDDINPYFYINEIYEDTTQYGYYENGELYIFNSDELKIVPYYNDIVLDLVKIKSQLLDENAKSYDDISKKIVTTYESENIEDFVPQGYEIINDDTVIADMNSDELNDYILVMQRKENYITSNNYFAYPRIALIVINNGDSYEARNVLSNLIAPLTASETSDNFLGFSAQGNVISVKNEFFTPLESYYTLKLRYNSSNDKLQLIGYTRGQQKVASEINDTSSSYIYLETDFNLLTGKMNVTITTLDDSGNVLNTSKNKTFVTKPNIYYSNQIYYNSIPDIVSTTENKYIDKERVKLQSK